MIISHGVQDLPDFFFAHDCFRKSFGAGGSFTVSFTENFNRAFFFFDFALDTNVRLP